MAEIKITLTHPTDNSNIDIQFDDNLTANAVVEELISAQFLSPIDKNRAWYAFFDRATQTSFGGLFSRGETTFKQAGVSEGTIIGITIQAIGG